MRQRSHWSTASFQFPNRRSSNSPVHCVTTTRQLGSGCMRSALSRPIATSFRNDVAGKPTGHIARSNCHLALPTRGTPVSSRLWTATRTRLLGMLRARPSKSPLWLTLPARQPQIRPAIAPIQAPRSHSRDAALRPTDFSHWRCNEKSLVYWEPKLRPPSSLWSFERHGRPLDLLFQRSLDRRL